MNGILILNKPAGISSARAVSVVKRLLPRGTKIGHAGTLDPFATGVLLLLVGRATKSCEAIMDQPKQYDATIMFGATTATDDPESPQQLWPKVTNGSPQPEPQEIDNTLTHYKGQVLQTPPAFSALKVGGRRAYQLARSGAAVQMMPRMVQIYDIQRVSYTWPRLQIRVDCGRGTYIRALARDIGAALDVGGHLTQLCRTRIGPFRLEDAVALAGIEPATVTEKLIPMDRAVELLAAAASAR